jgi:WhiB family transcriptional regulator, redox-sensing transcriptional regulator
MYPFAYACKDGLIVVVSLTMNTNKLNVEPEMCLTKGQYEALPAIEPGDSRAYAREQIGKTFDLIANAAGTVVITDPTQAGKCRDESPDTFFPTDGSIQAAKDICALCDIRVVCLEYALTNRIDYGVWGGTSQTKRKQIIRERRAQNKAATALAVETT